MTNEIDIKYKKLYTNAYRWPMVTSIIVIDISADSILRMCDSLWIRRWILACNVFGYRDDDVAIICGKEDPEDMLFIANETFET